MLAVISLVMAHPLLAEESDPDIGPPALEAAIAQSHAALDAILNGNPSLYLALFADSDDITLGNPFGPFGEGREAVAATLANAASKYQRGVARVERIALYADEDFATLIEIEHDRAQLTGRDDFSEFSVRVTSLYRRFGSEWRLVHRHADPITTLRAAQPDALTQLASRYAAAWSSQQPEDVASFYAKEGRLVVNDGKPAVGRAAVAAVARSFMEAFPDLVVAFDRLERGGERVLFHWTLTGTNTGPGGTGAAVRISGVEAWLVGPEGLIADSAGAFDAEDYARQLGAGSAGSALTAAQKEVWQGEIDYWERVNSRDLQGYLALWHPDFTGWPCGAPSPADLSGLAEFAEGWFAGRTARGQRTVPKAEAVIVKDSFALTYLSAVTDWREANGQTATEREKFVHTWQRTPEGWKIIGGMCAPLEAYDAAVTAAQASDTDLTAVLANRTRVIIEGIRSGDVSGIIALYAPGSLYAADNATLLSDPESIESFWVNVAASAAHDATLEVLKVERLGPDAFVEIQKYDVFDEAGERLFGGYASILWRRVEGRWIIATDVSN